MPAAEVFEKDLTKPVEPQHVEKNVPKSFVNKHVSERRPKTPKKYFRLRRHRYKLQQIEGFYFE
jgi:hypothetical protein